MDDPCSVCCGAPLVDSGGAVYEILGGGEQAIRWPVDECAKCGMKFKTRIAQLVLTESLR